MSFDIRFLTNSPWGPTSTLSAPGMFLRIIQQLTGDGLDPFEDLDGSHLPMVKPVREMLLRIDTLDKAASKYRNKSAELTSTLQGDLSQCDNDQEAKLLTDNLMRGMFLFYYSLITIFTFHENSINYYLI